MAKLTKRAKVHALVDREKLHGIDEAIALAKANATSKFDDPRGGFNVVGVQVFHFQFGDFGQLAARDFSGRNLAGLFRTRFQVRGLLDQEARGCRLGDERKAAVRINGDDRRDWHVLFNFGRRCVERLTEFHDVDAALTQSGPDWWGRICGTRGHLQFNVTSNLLRHLLTLSQV